ncbi:MAG: hypothetical protein JSV03_04950 [Planctomycetota bacterium]|nr:MAG: hypothetical protein JSV03_04950 [Planctomycetota bacterium]
MIKVIAILASLFVSGGLTGGIYAEAEVAEVLLCHFWDEHDIHDPYGKMEYRAHPLQHVGQARGLPTMAVSCTVKRKDGGWWVYGWSCYGKDGKFKDTNPLQIIRCWTADGIQFNDPRIVYSDTGQHWLGSGKIVCRQTDNRLFMFAWARGKPGHALYVYSSPDGEDWKSIAAPAYNDHDAFGIIWEPASRQFVNYQTTYQKWNKKYPDNIGKDKRRVLSLRTSKDGIRWEPPLSVGFNEPHRDQSDLIVPDKNDPAELELYRVCTFPHQGRIVGLLCKYAPSPQIANTRKGTLHGPGLGAEWFFCREWSKIDRPCRDIDAIADIGNWMPRGEPIGAGDMLYWYNSGSKSIAGIHRQRIFYVFCRANGEFSSPWFTAPIGDLLLNASADRYDSYVMVEVQDENSTVIPGYEKEHCVHMGVDDTDLRLRWGDKSIGDLAGQKVRVRIYFRDARIYGLKGTRDK